MSSSTTLRRGTDQIHRWGVLTALALALLLPGCDEEPTRYNSDAPVTGMDPVYPTASTTSSTLDLPAFGSVSNSTAALQIVQGGTGTGGKFFNNNSSGAGHAVEAKTQGRGNGVYAANFGLGRGALILTSSTANLSPALEVVSASVGQAGAAAIDVKANNPYSVVPAAIISTIGKGTALSINHKGSAGDLATYQVSGANKIRFSRTGRGYFNGGTQNNGADVAEAFEVEGSVRAYQPGDVLVISTRGHRKVEKSDEPYSTRVVGVHATRPGVLLTERDIEASLDDMVPLGVIGVIPTKVSAENGAIHPGDLLVTAGTPGHAMAADPERLHFGMVLGKALENFPGPDTGTIRVLVNVK